MTPVPEARRSQCARSVLMVRPSAFGYNEETAGTNRFQAVPSREAEEIRSLALAEFDDVVDSLRRARVRVFVVPEQDDRPLPDAVFPNNWISTHHDGVVVLYPMFSPLRRLERREGVVEALRRGFDVRRIVDFSPNEERGRFLEGTGSIVFDHPGRIAYASLSARTHRSMLYEAQEFFGYEFVVFRATDEGGRDLYHTNVVMSIGERFAVVCTEAIEDRRERSLVLDRLSATGRDIFRISREQMMSFAANVLELRGADGGAVLAASERAWQAFTPDQQRRLGELVQVVAVPTPTIESVGGGSVRCMIVEIFLPSLE